MVNSSQFIVTIPQSTLVFFYPFNTNIFSAQALSHKKSSAAIAHVAMLENATDLHMVRVVNFEQSHRITTSRTAVTARRRLHIKRFMRPVLVVLNAELIEPPLLTDKC
jgi:hypothetical protein